MPSTRTSIYAPDEFIITFGPVEITTGRAEGEFLRIEQESDDVADVVGADGEVSLSRINDRRTDITLILLASSPHNDLLSIISNAIREAPNMVGGIHPFNAFDANGNSLYFAANAWIKKAPDRSWGDRVEPVEWMLRAAHLQRIDGSSNTPV
jgi:hypothetical protein